MKENHLNTFLIKQRKHIINNHDPAFSPTLPSPSGARSCHTPSWLNWTWGTLPSGSARRDTTKEPVLGGRWGPMWLRWTCRCPSRLRSELMHVVPLSRYTKAVDRKSKDDWQHQHECIRINYAAQNPERIAQGLKLIAQAVGQAYLG